MLDHDRETKRLVGQLSLAILVGFVGFIISPTGFFAFTEINILTVDSLGWLHLGISWSFGFAAIVMMFHSIKNTYLPLVKDMRKKKTKEVK